MSPQSDTFQHTNDFPSSHVIIIKAFKKKKKKWAVWEKQIKYSILLALCAMFTCLEPLLELQITLLWELPRKVEKFKQMHYLKKKNLPLPSTPPENECQCVHWIFLNLKPTSGYLSPGKGLYLQNLNNHTIISQTWRLCTVIFSLSKWPIEHPGTLNVYVYF